MAPRADPLAARRRSSRLAREQRRERTPPARAAVVPPPAGVRRSAGRLDQVVPRCRRAATTGPRAGESVTMKVWRTARGSTRTIWVRETDRDPGDDHHDDDRHQHQEEPEPRTRLWLQADPPGGELVPRRRVEHVDRSGRQPPGRPGRPGQTAATTGGASTCHGPAWDRVHRGAVRALHGAPLSRTPGVTMLLVARCPHGQLDPARRLVGWWRRRTPAARTWSTAYALPAPSSWGRRTSWFG